jgi:hypothetical protein
MMFALPENLEHCWTRDSLPKLPPEVKNDPRTHIGSHLEPIIYDVYRLFLKMNIKLAPAWRQAVCK